MMDRETDMPTSTDRKDGSVQSKLIGCYTLSVVYD